MLIEIEMDRNAEGSTLMSFMTESSGYRVAGPKAWGGATRLGMVKSDPNEILKGLKNIGCADEIIAFADKIKAEQGKQQ